MNKHRAYLLQEGATIRVVYPDGTERDDIEEIRLEQVPTELGDSTSHATFVQGPTYTVVFNDGSQLKIG